jgi:hypothetical protein
MTKMEDGDGSLLAPSKTCHAQSLINLHRQRAARTTIGPDRARAQSV